MVPDLALRIPPRPEMVLGAGSVAQLPALVRRLGAAEAFVVTDRGVVAAGIAERVLCHFAAEGLPAAVFDGVGANPSAADVAAGVERLHGVGARPVAVVALGGGSAIDAAKAIALQAVNDRPLDQLDDRAGELVAAPPLIGVPTTAGTGSETNAFGVIDDRAARRKRYVGHASTMPRVAVLDPALTVSAPPAVTAACGIDVLAHAVESLQARDGNAYATGLALEAVRLVFDHLPAVVADGRDPSGRTAMLLAAHIAGLAFATTGLGTAHAIGHALSARHGTAHGVALAAVLPEVVAFNAGERPDATARVAEAARVPGGAVALPAAIGALQERAGLRPALRDLGVGRGELSALAEAALADEVVLNAPRVPSRPELLQVLEAAF